MDVGTYASKPIQTLDQPVATARPACEYVRDRRVKN
jgi:hypothetical protein